MLGSYDLNFYSKNLVFNNLNEKTMQEAFSAISDDASSK